MERLHIDDLLGQIRKKIVRGSKHTRHGRLRGALRKISVQHPTKPREYGRSTLGEELNMGPTLHDAIQRFRGISEANTPAPAPKGKVASGAQTASKSNFDTGTPKGQEKYDRTAASVPGDAEAKAAATRSTAGVKGPGYDASGREKTDVRTEQLADSLVKEDESLGAVIGMCYEAAETPEEFVGLVEKYFGFEKLKHKIAAKGGASNAGAVAASIGMKKYGKKKFEKAAHAGKPMKHEDAPLDNFGPSKDDEDISFANAMLADRVGAWGKRMAESNIPAPGPDNKGPDGKAQTASKSNFDDRTKPDKTYSGDAAAIPADAEAKAAATRATAGVHGPGYDASGRERVDVRTEQREPDSRGPMPGEDPDHAFLRITGLV